MLNAAAAAQNWQGEFEAELTNTLLVAVVSLPSQRTSGKPKINCD